MMMRLFKSRTLAMLLLAAGSIGAATITVTTLGDVVDDQDGECSLREAMLNAEGADPSGSAECAAGSPGGNVIVFAPALAGKQISVKLGPLPTITRNLEIQGLVPGEPEGIILSAGGQSRILEIQGSAAHGECHSLAPILARPSEVIPEINRVHRANDAQTQLQPSGSPRLSQIDGQLPTNGFGLTDENKLAVGGRDEKPCKILPSGGSRPEFIAVRPGSGRTICPKTMMEDSL